MTKQPLNILSLGAGIQSTTIARMSACGELPPLDGCIFADTGWERAATYAHLETLKTELAAAGIPVHVVMEGAGVRESLLNSAEGNRYASIPVHVQNADGSRGIGRRQCTREYKIAPITRKVRELLGLKPRQRVKDADGVVVRQWLGITIDEADRMKPSGKKWAENVWPLIDWRPMTRQDCIAWNLENGYEIPPRSACIGCPFQGGHEWAQLAPSEVEDAAEVEDAIQQQKWNGTAFLHRSCQPLREVDLRSDVQRGQGTLWPMECSGICGV